MPRKERTFPPAKIADLDRRSAGNYLSLLRDMRNQPVTLVIGAGVSASAGLPTWDSLLRKVCAAFFHHWEFRGQNLGSPPREMTIAFYNEEFWTNNAVVNSNKFITQDPLLIAQQIKNCIRESDWHYLLRKIVYNYDLSGNYRVSASALINSITEYCAAPHNPKTIISFNWDNILERELKRHRVSVVPIWEDHQAVPPGAIPIYYPHGFLPLGGGPVSTIVLAEREYQQAATEIYSWANLIQTQAYCNSICIFIGTSMTDPNLRRLLNISTEVSQSWNYAFLPGHNEPDNFEVMRAALFDLDLSRLGVKVVRFPVDASSSDSYSRLPELIDLLRIAIADSDAIWK